MNIVIFTIWIGAHTYHQPHVIPSQSSIPASAASNLDRAEEHVLCVLHEHGKTVELLQMENLVSIFMDICICQLQEGKVQLSDNL